jgi:Ni2+-binding GTPase involved in maturation of urease and hydrogenase
MLGGFLGAGKTTAMARAAGHYMRQGLNVGLVTNDQSYGLVDTETLKAQGFSVGEVPGACFCCKFDELVATVEALSETQQPDVVLAEPVGSCTDLVATVIEPMQQFFGERFEVGPLAVLLKPEHGRKILKSEPNAGFSPKAAYIFLKQLEEADVIVINKIDKLNDRERAELVRMVEERFVAKPVIAMSARDGDGFAQLIQAWDSARSRRGGSLSIDYDVYAAGEAELGWLNCRATITCRSGSVALDDIVIGLAQLLRQRWLRINWEPAHLKVMGIADGGWSVANLVSSGDQAELSCASNLQTDAVDVVINARVAADPDELRITVQEEVRRVAGSVGGDLTVESLQSFRPGRPQPTHRLADGHQ